MRISHLQIISVLAKCKDIRVVALMLRLQPASIRRVVSQIEKKWGIRLFDRVPWLNQSHRKSWELCDGTARTIIGYIDEIVASIDSAEGIAMTLGSTQAHQGTRQWLRTGEIERVVLLNGNSISLTARLLNIGRTQISDALVKIEKWLGVEIYSSMPSIGEKYKVPNRAGELILPCLRRIYSSYEDILELVND